MATNKIETLGSALIGPGLIDRKTELPLPAEKTKNHIFQVPTSRMTLADDVTLDDLITAKDELSGVDIKAVCTEASLMASWERRMKGTNEDLRKSKENAHSKGIPEGLYLKWPIVAFGQVNKFPLPGRMGSCPKESIFLLVLASREPVSWETLCRALGGLHLLVFVLCCSLLPMKVCPVCFLIDRQTDR